MAKKKVVTDSSNGLFDHINAIYSDQSIAYFDGLTEKEKKTYNQYMVNRFLSMNPVQIEIVNEIQKYGKIPDRAHYLFFAKLLPRRKQFNKYIKSKGDKYPGWLIELVASHFKTSKREARDYLTIFYMNDDHLNDLRDICRMYGKTEKEIKELNI